MGFLWRMMVRLGAFGVVMVMFMVPPFAVWAIIGPIALLLVGIPNWRWPGTGWHILHFAVLWTIYLVWRKTERAFDRLVERVGYFRAVNRKVREWADSETKGVIAWFAAFAAWFAIIKSSLR